MIANSEINENGIIYSDSFLGGPDGFVKNQFPPPPLHPLTIYWKFYCPFKKEAGG